MDQTNTKITGNEEEAKLSAFFLEKFGILPVIGSVFSNFQTYRWSLVSYTVHIISYVSLGIVTMNNLYTGYLIRGSLSMFSASFHLFLVGCVILTASSTLMVQRKKFTQFMLGFCWNQNVCEYQNSPYYEMLEKKSDQKLLQLMLMFGFAYGSCGLVGLSAPVIDKNMGTDQSVTNVSGIYWKGLPFTMWWPYDAHNDVTAYITALLFQGTYAIIAPIMCTAAIIMCFFSCEKILNHMKVLVYSVQHLEQRARARFDNQHPPSGLIAEYDQCFYECIVENVKHHYHILKAKDDFLELANYAIAVPFFGGAMLLGLSLLNLLSHDDPRIGPKIFLASLGTSEAANMLLLCMYGEAFQALSEELFNSVFYTRWYKRSMKCRRALMIFRWGTFKPMKIKAAQLIELNMETFGNLVNSAYSIFNLSAASAITKTVKNYVPDAIIESKFGNEIIFVLPTKDSKKLESLCSRLDDGLSRLNAISYGISDTSLEEIFLRITDDDSPEEDEKTKSFVMDFFHNPFKMKPANERSEHREEKVVRLKGANVTYSQVPIRVTNERVEKKTTNKYVRQYFALHSKRYHHTKRDFKALFSELVLPPVLVAVALAVLSVSPRLLERPPLELTPTVYGSNLTFFAKDETPGKLSDTMSSYRRSIYDELGLGTICLFWNGTESPCDKIASFSENPAYQIASCSCKTGAQICSDILDDPPPSYSKIVSGDYVYNMDSLNTSKWITSTIRKYALRNLGGFEFGTNLTVTDEALVTLKRLSEFGFIDPEIAKYLPDKIRPTNHNIKVWFNNKAWMASVANLNAIHNNVLRVHAMRNGTLLPPWQQYGIVVINHPLRFTAKQMEVERIQQSGFSLLQAISVIFALSFVTASFLLYLIEERISNAKHLQLVSGVNKLVYWVQAYCWDLAAYTLSALLCIFVFLMFDSPAYTSKDNFAGFVLLFFLYGWSCIPMMYPASFIFNVPSSAFVAMGCGNMFIGIITTITTSVLQSFPDEELRNIAKILSEVFLVFPHFCLGDGMIKLSVHHFSKVSLSALDVTIEADVLEWNFLGKNMFCMFVLGIMFFLLTLAIEYNVFRSIRHYFKKEEVGLDFGVGDEEDVALERRRVYNNPNDLLIIKDLTKKYRRKATPSVNKVCIGVKRGECFGLLGLNGAGKTTTFKMLTGAVKPSSGEATVGGYSINGASINDVRALLGYCPQFDALDPLMTPYEHLVFYARIRNIPSDLLQTRVDHLIKRMALGHYRNRLAGDLSGGNKRKLSTGIALLGNPPLVFLDEPTTGMDPKARRFLWTCISDIVKEGGCVILTSHSMEECQALCTRLTIMVNGQFTCLGSSQHLKNKYGKGYLLIIRCAENSKDEVKEFMRERISSSKITDEHFTQLRYEVPQSRLSEVLKELETAKSRNIVVDYSVTQTTLEEVFLRFAREQADPNDRKQKKSPTLFDCCLGKGYKSDKHVSPKQSE